MTTQIGDESLPWTVVYSTRVAEEEAEKLPSVELDEEELLPGVELDEEELLPGVELDEEELHPGVELDKEELLPSIELWEEKQIILHLCSKIGSSRVSVCVY